EILDSQPKPGDFLPVSPDVSICPDCLRELFDPADRRYRYPFINCTNCGPRFTIVQDIPYDRPKTTMSGFKLCPNCEAEYKDPRNRRFHAQPVACPVCGPHIWFEADGDANNLTNENALQTARKWLKNGRILAIKGLGGYHLVCDANNRTAIEELRKRKQRSDKGFALMAFDLSSIEKHCLVTDEERDLLESIQRPIVLLDRKPGSTIPMEAAPGQNTLGFMLPYTPLHYLILEPEEGFPEVLVMTSGNLSEEPIAFVDADAKDRLTSLADGFLQHNRPIHMRTDDSVARIIDGAPYLHRRARGYTPDPIRLPYNVPSILAAGAELKNTFCLTRDHYAFVSHHIGDMENLETFDSFTQGIEHFKRLFRIEPTLLACDLHPDYLASKYARQLSADSNLPLVEVQHHHAHLASCLADNGWTTNEPVIGLIYDGTGYGTDGKIWGGEVLIGGYQSYTRRFHLAYTPLPGGDLAIRRPARMALASLWQNQQEWEPEFPPSQALCYEERTALRGQLEHHLNTPLTSSIGRLFDAASALIGIRQSVSYEGQAAIEMEAVADPSETGYYPLELNNDTINPAHFWEALIADYKSGVIKPVLSARIHNSIVHTSLAAVMSCRNETSITTVVLSGGVWQNRYLLNHTIPLLEQEGFRVFIHRQVPANDGGISLGQAMVANWNKI
ncbi:MAG: carbamoyltransferase HypF, partial [Anaerolineaceae bacterium]|nr:carbamoyltransferase HypF [Anaerolineaceae bacterium]